jgi:DNA-binding PucR family transcriptional regulator
MRPLIEQKNIETNYRIATTEAYQRAVHERTTHDIRALFRGNVSEEKLQNGISKLIMDHLNNGGSPYSVASFIRDAALSAYLTKQESKFLSVIQNPGRLNDAMRLVNSMTRYNDG